MAPDRVPGRRQALDGFAHQGSGCDAGFQVKDSKGDKFLIKFDLPDSSDLSTSAGVIVGRLFWAAGYNVPDDAIAYFRAEDLLIAADATFGRSRPQAAR